MASKSVILGAGVLGALVLGGAALFLGLGKKEPIRVGVLHSLTGTMAISETSVVDATKLAIEEINARGGLLGGRMIEPIIVDGKSDWPTFEREAEQLISQQKVDVVFGCWTSASRRTVKPVFEKNNHLLFYPVQYEGLEASPNIVYTGAAPNQQILPAVKWAIDQGWKKFYLVGSDYVFPRSANEIIKSQIAAFRGELAGEDYLLLGETNVQQVVDNIVKTQPAVILNTINGDTNVAFYKALRAAGITPDKIPSISFSIAEPELQAMGTKEMAGDYAAWNYFQSIETPENKAFVTAFKNRFGQDRVTSDPMEAAYMGVHLWAKAVEKAGTSNVSAVRSAIKNLGFKAPEGEVFIDQDNNHTWKYVSIGQIQQDGQFKIVWSSDKPIGPVPYPNYKSVQDWEKFLTDMYEGWKGKWANPGLTH